MAKSKSQPALDCTATAAQLSKKPLPNSDAYLTINKLLNQAALKGAWSAFSKQAEKGLLRRQASTSRRDHETISASQNVYQLTGNGKGKEKEVEKSNRKTKIVSSSSSSTSKSSSSSRASSTTNNASTEAFYYHKSQSSVTEGSKKRGTSSGNLRKVSKLRQSMKAQSLKDVEDAKSVARKSVLSLDPSIKRMICRTCSTLLFPGINCSIRIKPFKPHKRILKIVCYECSTSRRFPAPHLRSKSKVQTQPSALGLGPKSQEGSTSFQPQDIVMKEPQDPPPPARRLDSEEEVEGLIEQETSPTIEEEEDKTKGKLSQRARRRLMSKRRSELSSSSSSSSKRVKDGEHEKTGLKTSRRGRIKTEVSFPPKKKASKSKTCRKKKDKKSLDSLSLQPFSERIQGSGWSDDLERSGIDRNISDGLKKRRGDHIVVEGVGKGNHGKEK